MKKEEYLTLLIRSHSDSYGSSYILPNVTPKASACATSNSFEAKAHAFYSWYLSIRQDTFPQEGFRFLQSIMQIGKKNTATQQEAEAANENLSNLMEELEDGKKSLGEIPSEIQKILNSLTENNPKSRIIMQVTEVEIAINLFQIPPSKELKDLIKNLLQKVGPNLSRIQAVAITRLLEQELKSESPPANLKKKFFSLLN